MTSAPGDSILAAKPALADPFEVSAALARVAENAQAVFAAAASNRPRTAAYDASKPLAALADFTFALWSHPERWMAAQARAWRDFTALSMATGARLAGIDAPAAAAPAKGDRRFAAADWSDQPAFDWLKQAFLLAEGQVRDLVARADLDARTRVQVDFFTRQMLNALAPSNFALTNPQVLRKTVETGGLNLLTGLGNLLEDVADGKGLVRRRTPQTFELGVNIAATPGAVIFQNELMQLIQYSAATETVYRKPLLFVPPLVNKYYLFDLTPKSSFLKWLVDQGHTVFVISWVNPTEQHAAKDLADYVRDGVLAALAAVEKATGETGVDLVSYCLGGVLSAMAMAWLAAKGEGERVATATLIATLVDFEDMGEWQVFVGEDELATFGGYLDEKGFVEAHDLTKLFSAVRANDLIWSAVVTHYLLGEEARPSDLLWWFDDAARIPAGVLRDYGRLMLHQNRLRQAGGIVIDGVEIDLGAIETPVFMVAFKDDHVAAWPKSYAGLSLFGGEKRFLVGGSGHNAGMINPPAANKHGYWSGEALPASAEAWLEAAPNRPGSWWPEWESWLAGSKAGRVPAREVGAGELPAIEAAPGSYVRVSH
ncbi:MAG: class I poly(R)-hydroxyalkanoic acid synthase [Pseudomonadota bacterium]|nr:class I poly(R)-hydroxyalkanoic acid synthase [Pseudomonadota bacterium]